MFDLSKVHSVQCLPVSTLDIPDWFQEELAGDAPFSWGDNNYSLAAPCDWADYMERRHDYDGVDEGEEEDEDDAKIVQIIVDLRSLDKTHPDLYIDLEN